MDDTSKLTAAFHDKLLEAVQICKTKLNYNPSYFLRMLGEHGPTETARQLIMSRSYSEGFTKLWELGRLDLSVEAVTIRCEFRPLFSPEVVSRAEKRLRECGFNPTGLE